MDRMETIIQRLKDNGLYDCPDCKHKASDIQWLVKIAEAADKVNREVEGNESSLVVALDKLDRVLRSEN